MWVGHLKRERITNFRFTNFCSLLHSASTPFLLVHYFLYANLYHYNWAYPTFLFINWHHLLLTPACPEIKYKEISA